MSLSGKFNCSDTSWIHSKSMLYISGWHIDYQTWELLWTLENRHMQQLGKSLQDHQRSGRESEMRPGCALGTSCSTISCTRRRCRGVPRSRRQKPWCPPGTSWGPIPLPWLSGEEGEGTMWNSLLLLLVGHLTDGSRASSVVAYEPRKINCKGKHWGSYYSSIAYFV